MIAVLAEDNPGTLLLAAEATSKRTDNLAEKMRRGAEALPNEMRDMVSKLF